MALGIINGGFGLKLSNASKSVMIGYAVAAAVLFLAYIAAKIVGSFMLAPARAKKNLDRNVNVSGNGRHYNDDRRHNGPQPDMAYQPAEQQQQTSRHFNKGPSAVHNDGSARSSANNNGASVPQTAGRTYEDENDQYRNQLRREREARRYA